MIIRRAEPREAKEITDLAVVSEAFWGHDKKFLDKFRVIYEVTEDFIRNNPTLVLEESNKLIGFYSIVESDEDVILEYFYIDPIYIRKGYGMKLWNDLIEYCKNRGILEFQFVAGDEAKDFYLRMGAIKIGETFSLVNKNRKISKWKVVL